MYKKDKSNTFCTSILCFGYGHCDKLAAKDFKFKIGGAEGSFSQTKFFSVPSSSYLIDAKDLNISGDFCILGIAGYVPKEVNKYIFGSVFL